MKTIQFADKPTHSQSSQRPFESRTGQLADNTSQLTKMLDGMFKV